MRFIKLALIAVSALALTGCYDAKNVPPASIGKLLTVNGYEEGFLEPGRHRLSWSYFGRELVLLPTSVFMREEPMVMVLQDKLRLGFTVKTRLTLSRNPAVLEGMFDQLTPEEVAGANHKTISLDNIYLTYVKMAVEQAAREVVTQYSVEEVQTNYARISPEIRNKIAEALVGTPVELQDAVMTDIRYPEIVTQGVELAKKRQLQIAEAEAAAQKEMVEAQKELEVAQAQREVALVRARTERDANQIIGEGITPQFLQLRRLEVQERVQTEMARNGAVTFMPFEALDEVGTSIRMFNKGN